MTQQLTSDKSFWLSVAFKYTRDKKESEELVQEAIVRYLNKKTLEVENAKAYIAATIRHLHVNTGRRKKRHAAYSKTIMHFDDSKQYTKSNIETETEIKKWLKIISTVLTPAERAVFILKEAFEYDYAAMEQTFGWSYENLRVLLFRAKSKISKHQEALLFSETESVLFTAFSKASKHGDVEGLIDVLKQDIEKDLPRRA